MGSHFALSLLRLSRIDTSLLVFLTVFIPTLSRSQDIRLSLWISMPALTASMLTFVLNDYDDYDSDKLNHPNRPIAAGMVSLQASITFYFALLAITVTLVYSLPQPVIQWLYMTLAVLTVSYAYVKREFPVVKGGYVALCAVIPTVIAGVAAGAPSSTIALLSGILIAFCWSRELLMDVIDVDGDTRTIPRLIGKCTTVKFAFLLQIISLLPLIFVPNDTVGFVIYSVIVFITIACAIAWRRSSMHEYCIFAMKIQMLLAIYFIA